jgi:phage/plasmid-like protein (TIGR03299 family)
MAHEIRSNDTVLLARTAAWHGLGTVLPSQFTPAEALTIGGLDWEVEESTALTATFAENDGTATRNIVESHKSLRRSDDKTVLATVGAGYTPVQNRTLAEIAAAFNADGRVLCETAGSLLGGRKVWFLLGGGTIDVGGKGDLVNRYLMLHNAHDGTASLGGDIVTTRVVCHNTYTGALREGGAFFRYRHTSGVSLRVEDIKRSLDGFFGIAAQDDEAMAALASRSLSRAEIQSLWTDVLVALDGPIATNPKDEKQARRRVKAVEALANMTRVFDTESQQFGATAWVAANAVTNYIQYHRGYLKGDARTNSDLFGSYADAKRLAMKEALALV